MGDVSQSLSCDPTFDARSPFPHDKNPSPSGRRLSDIHIPSPDHSVSIFSSEHFDKVGLVAAQEAALHDAAILEMGWTGGESDEYAFMPEGEKPKSPAIGSLQDLKSLRPIRLRNMKIGKVHRGRILSGTLCCKSVKIFALMNVLEEEGTGDATKLVISNAVPRSATTATVQRLYPEDAQLSVREPYLKRFADGMVGILVENPNDIVFNYLPDEIPSPVSERENLLWPVYKDPSGNGQDTPGFNTYGSFLSSPSLLSRNSLNSPITPRSPRSFLDDPLDGVNVRTIRKFKSFRKQEESPDDHASELQPTQNHIQEPGGPCKDNREDGDKAAKPITDEDLEARDGQTCETNGSVVASNPYEEEYEHPSSPTGGLISKFNCLLSNPMSAPEADSEQFVSLGMSDLSLNPIAENVYNLESLEKVVAAPSNVLDAVPLCREDKSCENDSRGSAVIFEPERSFTADTDRHVDSHLGVIVEESPAGHGAILVGIDDEADGGSRIGSALKTCEEEGLDCKLPLASVEAVADTSAGQSNQPEAATGDGLDTSLLDSLDSGVELTLEITTETFDSGSHVQIFPGNKESDEGRAGTSHPDCVGREVGVVAPGSGLQCNHTENSPLPDSGKEDTAGVHLFDCVGTPVSSTALLGSPGANGDDKLEGSEANCSVSAGEGHILSNGVQSDDGVDGDSHHAEVHTSTRDCGSGDKDVDEPIAFSDVIDHSQSNGSSLPAIETNEPKVDPKRLKSLEVVDAPVEEELSAAALRLKGNQRFARQDWTGAVELYTRAIHRALQESKEQMGSSKSNGAHHVSGNGMETEIEVVMDYSNRSEAWLRLHHYERAWADAERALAVDPRHLKSLFRKGRALLGLEDYQQALMHLESAYARAPFDKDLLAAIKLSRIGDHQSRQGIYELTDYYLRGRFAGEIPTCADHVGPVQVRATVGNKGRGLFLTKHVEAGDLLLVSNPLAMLDSMCSNKKRKTSLHSDDRGRLDPEVQEKLVQAVRERGRVSTKNRQRLLALCHSEDSTQQPVPSMDLFIPGRRVAPSESLNLEEERITRLVVRNAIDRNMVYTPMEKRHDPPSGDLEDHEERVFWGLWVLPSFINHSCIPNVSMVVIGRALFVYASKDLNAGEELLCSYFSVFQPLPQRREITSRCWGFTCECARCLLEARFESSLKTLYSLHSRHEPNPELVVQFSPYSSKSPAKDLAKELEVIEITKKLDHRERCWLQASFTQLYTCSRDFMGRHESYPYLEAALHAMQVVHPGSNSTLEVGLLVREAALKDSNGKKTSQYKAVNQQVHRICQCIYGKQKPAVLQSLIDGSRSDTTIRS